MLQGKNFCLFLKWNLMLIEKFPQITVLTREEQTFTAGIWYPNNAERQMTNVFHFKNIPDEVVKQYSFKKLQEKEKL